MNPSYLWHIWGELFAASAWLLAIGWAARVYQWIRHSGEVPDLLERTGEGLSGSSVAGPAVRGDRPDLTVIVPACNEEANIEETLRSLLASERVRVQILAVDDRSTDHTGEIMDGVAASCNKDACEHSLQVIHISQLPPGWLGKPHALSTAADLAEAEWILFTDGDVSFAHNTASLALSYAVANNIDHLVLMPDWIMKTAGEAAMHGAMHALTTWTLRLWRIADPKARDFLGVGAFNLVRRNVYEKLGGFRSLRMEILEDLRLGWKVKRAGYSQRVVLGHGLAAVRWSHGAWGVVRNLEKNLFALYRYNLAAALAGCLGLAIQIVWPIAAILAGGWTRLAGILMYAAVASLYLVSSKVTRVSPILVVFYPVGLALFLFAHVRSVTLALVRGGVVWRGTLYSLDELRENAGPMW